MSLSNTSEATSTSPGPTSSKQHTSACETVHNNSSDGKDLLHSLKGQVSFAKQCLGLLQNQMKHAMDTLEILQDQVIKAQSTIDKIERKGSKKACGQKIQSVVVSNDYQTSVDELSPGAVPIQGHRMLVVDTSGQPLYAIDKPASAAASSCGIPVQHQGGPCLCPSCNNIGLGHPVFITEQGQQLIAIHSGQAVYHIDGKQAASPACSSYDLNDKKDEHQTASTLDHTCPKKRKYSATSVSDTEESPSPRQSYSNNEPNVSKGDSKSSSPITSQLLQVLDVLQNAGDDDNEESVVSSGRSMRGSGHSSIIPFTGPVPHKPAHTASGTGILAVGRRCRKQDMSPFKKEDVGLSTQTLNTERELPELMKVPPPVLAATLEPDFLVVPGNSYFSDSPPSSAGGSSREKERPKERRSSETRTSSVVEVKKEHIGKVEPRRSSSTSSLSQVSDASSRSLSESSSSERFVPQSLDPSRRSEAFSETAIRVTTTHQHEHTARDQRVEENTSPSHFKNHPNGELSHKSNNNATYGESKITHSITAAATRASLLNSTDLPDKAASDTTTPSQLSPKKSPVRLIKVSPLNSTVAGSTIEHRRPSLDYTPNHGIVRISNATSMTSPKPCPSSQQTKNVQTAESPTLNDVHKSSLNSYVYSSASDSDLQMVTTYSVAQIGSEEQKCTSPSKRPNILSRTRQNKKDIPQGIVVLVPTIEDAKQLIKSSGGNQGSTPVLVPQNVLNQFSANGEIETAKKTTDSHVTSSFVGKRPHYSESSLSYPRSKRSLTEPLIID